MGTLTDGDKSVAICIDSRRAIVYRRAPVAATDVNYVALGSAKRGSDGNSRDRCTCPRSCVADAQARPSHAVARDPHFTRVAVDSIIPYLAAPSIQAPAPREQREVPAGGQGGIDGAKTGSLI